MVGYTRHDHDENGNYLEPLHYFLFGSGAQTWEWHHSQALRSPLPLLPSYISGWIAKVRTKGEMIAEEGIEREGVRDM
jgi:hypothetical protein